MCDYSDAYIVVKNTSYFEAVANSDMSQKDVKLKNNALFSLCIIKIKRTIASLEDLDVV